jgi:hypothetical protein
MVQLPITPRRVAPYVISGVTGVHILARLRRATKQPANDIPLHFFLLKHTDIVLTLSGASVVMWHLAKHNPRQQAPGSMAASFSTISAVRIADKTKVEGVVHQLRQVFTALLLGLGLIDQKADLGDTAAIHGLVKRLLAVVRQGIEAVNVLDADEATDGREKEYGG